VACPSGDHWAAEKLEVEGSSCLFEEGAGTVETRRHPTPETWVSTTEACSYRRLLAGRCSLHAEALWEVVSRTRDRIEYPVKRASGTVAEQAWLEENRCLPSSEPGAKQSVETVAEVDDVALCATVCTSWASADIRQLGCWYQVLGRRATQLLIRPVQGAVHDFESLRIVLAVFVESVTIEEHRLMTAS